jgi:hypothetical protein
MGDEKLLKNPARGETSLAASSVIETQAGSLLKSPNALKSLAIYQRRS